MIGRRKTDECDLCDPNDYAGPNEACDHRCVCGRPLKCCRSWTALLTAPAPAAERGPTEQERSDIAEGRYVMGLVTVGITIPTRPTGLPTLEETQALLDRLLYIP